MVEDHGTEATRNLYMQNDRLFGYKSFMTQLPSLTIIQVAEDSEVFSLSALDCHELVKISDLFFRLGKIFEQAVQNQDYQQKLPVWLGWLGILLSIGAITIFLWE
jgi:hypothetical protein